MMLFAFRVLSGSTTIQDVRHRQNSALQPAPDIPDRHGHNVAAVLLSKKSLQLLEKQTIIHNPVCCAQARPPNYVDGKNTGTQKKNQRA